LKICYQIFLATYPRNFVERQNLLLLFGLALGGVYHAISITRNAVRSYRTISPLPKRRYIFCGTFPRVTPAGSYPAPSFYRARTFLFKKATTHSLTVQKYNFYVFGQQIIIIK